MLWALSWLQPYITILTLVTGKFLETGETKSETSATAEMSSSLVCTGFITRSKCWMQWLCHPMAPWRRTWNYLQISNSPGVRKKSVLDLRFDLLQIRERARSFYPANCAVDVRWFVGVQAALVMNMRFVQYDMLGAVYRAGWTLGFSLTGVQ